MNTFVNSALALAAASSLGFAGTGSGWEGLDSSLASWTPGEGMGGMEATALIRSSFDTSSDELFQPTTGEDLQGIRFQNAKVGIRGSVNNGKINWNLSFEFADNDALEGDDGVTDEPDIENAYGSWMCGDNIAVTWGQFKAAVTQSSAVGDCGLVMIERTGLGHEFDDYDPGVMAKFCFDQGCVMASIQNGVDEVEDDWRITLRGLYNVNAGAGSCEGGYGCNTDDTNLTIGAAYDSEQDDLVDDSGLFVDAMGTMAGFSGNVEFGFLSEDYANFNGPTLWGNGGYTDDAVVMALTAAYMLQPDEWEVAVRFEDMDDEDETTALTVGANYYMAGHEAKWSINLVDVSSDAVDADGTLFRVGLSMGQS